MKKYFDVYPRVFYPSLIFILAFVFLSILGGEPVREFFDKTAYLVTESTGWLFILGVNLFVVICLYIAFSKQRCNFLDLNSVLDQDTKIASATHSRYN